MSAQAPDTVRRHARPDRLGWGVSVYSADTCPWTKNTLATALKSLVMWGLQPCDHCVCVLQYLQR